jgi:hypothetical protein
MTTRYPDWICHQCGTRLSRGHHLLVSTYHVGQCGWCERTTHVTEPRDYGFPPHASETQTVERAE